FLGIPRLARIDNRQRLGRTRRRGRLRRKRARRCGIETRQKAGEPGTLVRTGRANHAGEEIGLLFRERRRLREWRHFHSHFSAARPAPPHAKRQIATGNRWLTMTRITSSTRPVPRLQPISFFSTGRSGSACALRNSSPTFTCDIACSSPQLANGGFTPLKNSQEIKSPTQITKPNRLTRETAASRPMPSCQSFLKLESTLIEKKVRIKKTTRMVFASPIAAGTLVAILAGVASAR